MIGVNCHYIINIMMVESQENTTYLSTNGEAINSLTMRWLVLRCITKENFWPWPTV